MSTQYSNNSMLQSGEDYLRSQSIPTLRDLINNLQENASGKQSELQQLVGSYYHDFIQSADAIAKMADKSQSMDAKISQIWSFSHHLIEKTQDLLDCTDFETDNTGTSRAGLESPIAKKNTSITRRIALTSAEIWSYLDQCDIFNAVKVAYLSHFVVYISKCKSCPPPSFFDLIQANCSNDLKMVAFEASVLSDASSAYFLKETVLEDCFLVMLDDNSKPHFKSRTLAAQGILGSLKRGELLTRFLEIADIKLNGCIQSIVADMPAESVTVHLVTLVEILQEVLLDVHTLFFKVFEVGYDGTSANPKINGSKQQMPLSHLGLVVVHQVQLLNEISLYLNKLAKQSVGQINNSSIKSEVKLFQLASELLQADKSNSSPNEMRKILDAWLGIVVRKVSEKISFALSTMISASQVSHLQQKLWLVSTTLSISGRNQDMSNEESKDQMEYCQDDWLKASYELLLPTSKLHNSNSNQQESVEKSATYLWSLIFRNPFMSQVERLLQESCYEVLERVKSRVQSCLLVEGLVVDAKNLLVTLSNSSNTATSGLQSAQKKTPVASKVNGNLTIDFSGSTIDQLSRVNSIRLFHAAESIRVLLQHEMNDVLGAIILPVQESDTQSSQALSRALFVQSSQLISRFLIYIREIHRSIVQLLPDNKSLSNLQQDEGFNGLSNLVSGQLLMGRIAWLMKVRGRFLEDALASTFENSSLIESAYNSDLLHDYDLITEDQLMSAFEIADTNGDGVMTYDEAIDAVQALAIPGCKQLHGISPQLTPSLTFNEFALLSANILGTADLKKSVNRLSLSLDSLIRKSHDIWCTKIVSVLERTLTLSVHQEFLAGYNAKSAPTFKLFWRDFAVNEDDMDGLDEGTSLEKIKMPTTTTGSLQRFLFAINSTISSIMSIDTVQVLAPVTGSSLLETSVVDGGDQSLPIRCLTQYVKTRLYGVALKAVQDVYGRLLQETTDLHSKKEIMSADQEDIALQAAFDLLVIQKMAKQIESEKSNTIGDSDIPDFSKVLASWTTNIDPINASLVEPLLATASNLYLSKTRLLSISEVALSSPMAFDKHQSGSKSHGSILDLIFTANQTPRFGMLPLPLSMTTSSSVAGLSSKSAYGIGIASSLEDSSITKIISQSKTSSTVASKSSNLMSSLSSSISNIGSIGTFLSSGTSNS